MHEQVAGPVGILSDNGDDGVQRVEEEMRVDLCLGEQKFGFCEQVLLLDISGIKDLVGKQFGDAFAEAFVGDEKEFVLGLEQVDGADQLVVDPERYAENRAEGTVVGEIASPSFFPAIGINAPVFLDGLQGLGGADFPTDEVVVASHPNKGEDLVLVGYGHRTHTCLLPDYRGDFLSCFHGKPASENGHRPFRHFQSLGGENDAKVVVHFSLIANNADEDGGAGTVGKDHGQGDDVNQGDCLVKRLGQQQNDDHLETFGNHRGQKGHKRAEQTLLLVRSAQIKMDETSNYSFNGCG